MTPKEESNSGQVPATGYELFIMRHGIAAERSAADCADDAKRPLTPEGKKKTRECVAGLARMGFVPDWIVTSPLVRAAETAALVADEVGSRVPVEICDALRPGGSPEALITFLAKRSDRRHVLVVGHEPDLSELAARLIGA